MKNVTTSVTEWSIKKIRLVLILFLSFGLQFCNLKAQTLDSDLVKQAIEKQLESYPNSTLCDIYKSFFQDFYGPGHLIADSISAIRYMEQEIEQSHLSLCKSYEKVGTGKNFYRINLSLVKEGEISVSALFDALQRSIALTTQPDIDTWKKEWEAIEKTAVLFKNQIAGNYEKDKQFIEQMLSEGGYIMRHSKTYNTNYHPHYRLIHRTIFEQEILPLIKN